MVVLEHYLAAAIKGLRPEVPVMLISGLPPESFPNVDYYFSKGEPATEFIKAVRDLLG